MTIESYKLTIELFKHEMKTTSQEHRQQQLYVNNVKNVMVAIFLRVTIIIQTQTIHLFIHSVIPLCSQLYSYTFI